MEGSYQVFETDIAINLLIKCVEPLVKKIKDFSIEEWEKFKIDFDIAFRKYSSNSYEKYSKVKTILYRTEPQDLYHFFEIPWVRKGNSPPFLAEKIGQVLDLSNYILVRGSGGIGKSTLLKHFYINCLNEEDIIPIFMELKEINDIDGQYKFEDLLYKKLFELGSTVKKEYMEYALKSGIFVFLLDGYDEINTIKQERFIKTLESFCDKYPKNHYILSSRPCSEFIEFQRFTVLSSLPLTLEQAMSLIRKINFDAEIKERFLKVLETELFSTHESFASNPLLLSIMLLTFDNYAEIPEKLHIFYSNAFETLYSKHDATKSGYRREMRCKLSYDDFRNVFSCFCFITYFHSKYKFSHDEIISYLSKVIKTTGIAFDVNEYIYDLVSSLSVLYNDGDYLQFAHRSFQEYFSAVFLKELSDNQMEQLALQIIKRDRIRASNDSVFSMLFDMAQLRFEKNILLPLLAKVEESSTGSLYNRYITKILHTISLLDARDVEDGEGILLAIEFNGTAAAKFLFDFSEFYMKGKLRDANEINQSSDRMVEYLESKGYCINDRIDVESLLEDEKMYELFKYTWFGKRIERLSNLREYLKRRVEQAEGDILCLLDK